MQILTCNDSVKDCGTATTYHIITNL